jgi:hypothetical protein
VFGSPRPAPDSYPSTQPDPHAQSYPPPEPTVRQAPTPGAEPGAGGPAGHVHVPPPARSPYDDAPATRPYPPQYQQPQYPQPQQPQGPPRRPAGPGPGPEPRSHDLDRRSRSGGGLPFGLGTVLAVLGLAGVLAALLVLPWFTVAGQDVGLSDLRDAFTVAETRPESLPGANPEDPSVGEGGIPSADEVSEAVEDEVRDAATEAAAGAIDEGKARYLELYVEKLWVAVAGGVALAVVLATLLGLGKTGAFLTFLAAGAHGAALWIVFTGDSADNPAFGVWLGIAGLAAVFLGCILGPKRARG